MKQLNKTPFPAKLTYAKGELLNCHAGLYANGQTALLLTDAVNGSPVAKATVALDPFAAKQIPPGSVALKTWSENEGIVETLRDAGLILGEALLEVPCGFHGATAKVYALGVPA